MTRLCSVLSRAGISYPAFTCCANCDGGVGDIPLVRSSASSSGKSSTAGFVEDFSIDSAVDSDMDSWFCVGDEGGGTGSEGYVEDTHGQGRAC